MNCHGGAVLVFRKLYITAQFSKVHRTGSLSVTGHEPTAGLSYTELLDTETSSRMAVRGQC